jgi:hypothetical protein
MDNLTKQTNNYFNFIILANNKFLGIASNIPIKSQTIIMRRTVVKGRA